MSVPQYRKQNYDIQQNIDDAMNNNIDLYDLTLSEVYEYNAVSNLGLLNSEYNQNYFSNKYGDNEISGVLMDMLSENKNMQSQLRDIIFKEGNSLNKSIDKTADAYNNQKRMNDYVTAEKDVLEQESNQISDDIYNDKRQIEINNYYYKKNKAQMNILYIFIILCIVVYILNVLQNKLQEYVSDSVISIITGLLVASFIIYLFYALYDILLRDDIIFDEYVNNWSGKSGLSDKQKGLYDDNTDKKCIERPTEEVTETSS